MSTGSRQRRPAIEAKIKEWSDYERGQTAKHGRNISDGVSMGAMLILGSMETRGHILGLLNRALELFLAGQGTTGLGFISAPVVAIISATVTAAIIWGVQGPRAMAVHVRKNVRIVAGGAILGFSAWYGTIFALDVLRTINRDHISLTTENARLRQENSVLDKKVNTPPPTYIPPPPDPSLMKIGTVLTLIGDIHASLPDRVPITFLITAPSENTWLKSDLESILITSCRIPPQVICQIVSVAGSPDGIVPRPKEQGVAVHIHEPVESIRTPLRGSNRPPLIDSLPKILYRWFTVHKKLEYFPDSIIKEFFSSRVLKK